MSQLLIQQYLNQLASLKKVSGTTRESVVREAFKDLLKGWARSHDLVFVPEYEIATLTKERRYVDGALLHALRMPFGYWEAKDEKDDLDAEIAHKFKRGYPQDNIIFEDSTEAVLIQNKREVMRCPVEDVENLGKLLKLFFSHERAEVAEFRKAVTQFKQDLPEVLKALREMMATEHIKNADFRKASERFLAHAHDAINPSLTADDVREMLIQHVLTEEIFSKVFDESDFHRQNNVAKELYALEGTFFTGDLKKRTLRGLETYYAAIRAAAAQISSHHEKQTFLKVIYENFYKVYNAKAADRLGVVYTPNEIVRFMIESADWLCEKHFGRNLIDKDVEILDPATGTGTFICELLEHFRGQPAKLKHKYANELHANEVAILPYYVANLNIEATYAAITGEYREFENLCFVDTLDNVGLHTAAHGSTQDLFGSVSEENVVRIKRQNSKKISVIIGNPPYNANQLNENDNNKNREYPAIDARIKQTYIAESTAQKTKLYDMYARFFRWASDRLSENGMVAFVSNSSFVNSRTFDGFRKVVAKEFNEIWIVDLKGNARTSGERRRAEGGNIFDDQVRVGVAIYFCVKKRGVNGCRVFYEAVRDYAKADEKRDFLTSSPLVSRSFAEVRPDTNGNWIDLANNDFETLMPIASKEVKATSKSSQEKAVFKSFANAVNTARDEWVYDLDATDLANKMNFAILEYNAAYEKLATGEKFDQKKLTNKIKWSEALIANVKREPATRFSTTRIAKSQYRPFVSSLYYTDSVFSDRLTSNHRRFFGEHFENKTRCIAISAAGPARHFYLLATNGLADWHFLGDTQLYPYSSDTTEGAHDNITDWSLTQFKKHYGTKGITKEAIFHYVYAVLHDPIYREKYALNLKREFPRIPFYADFAQWAKWGEVLMALHIGYESVASAKLKRVDIPDERARKAGLPPKAMLKADRDASRIVLDSETTLTGIPPEAWAYRLGNRSALEWILDQYKEKKPKDPTIREKFDTYRFADYKEKVIDLLQRVTTVSVETVKIVEAMKVAKR